MQAARSADFALRVHSVRTVEVEVYLGGVRYGKVHEPKRLKKTAEKLTEPYNEARRLRKGHLMHANAATAKPSVRDRFLADHRRIEGIVERLIAAFEADDREDIAAIWTELDTGVLTHFEQEEKYLFPVLQQTSPRDVRALLQEHRHLRNRLMELAAGIDLHMVRLQVARDFIEEIRAHTRNEDRLLYPMFSTVSEIASDITQSEKAEPRAQ